jgi:integrase
VARSEKLCNDGAKKTFAAQPQRHKGGQVKFRDLINDFEKAYMPGLSIATRQKYESLLRCHIKPGLAEFEIEQLTTRRLDEWLAERAAPPYSLSWASRTAARNLVSVIFSRAEIWETYEGRNPTRRATVGRKKAVYEKRKLTTAQSVKLLEAFPDDFRVIAMVAISCGMRISEVMGLCWKHVDFGRGMLLVRQRYYRGDLDVTKNEKSIRDIPFGDLAGLLRALYPGPHAGEDYCFSVRTNAGFTRSDGSMQKHFLRKAAEKLGLYYPGFGFRCLRREAVTEISSRIGAIQACRIAGHSNMNTTLLYGLDDYLLQEGAIKSIQKPYENMLSGDTLRANEEKPPN